MKNSKNWPAYGMRQLLEKYGHIWVGEGEKFVVVRDQGIFWKRLNWDPTRGYVYHNIYRSKDAAWAGE